MSKWSLENQLTLHCGMVVLCGLAIVSFWTDHSVVQWQGLVPVLLVASAATAVFRLLIAPDMRRMNSLVAIAERLARSDASARIDWVRPSGEFGGDAEPTARVEELAEKFLGSFREAFSLDEDNPCVVGKLSVPTLRCGKTALNLNDGFIDRFGSNGESATIFVLRNTDFVRISTTLSKPDGSRAVGTLLDKSGAAYKALIAGEAFTGKARLFGKDYATRYVPARSASGSVLGALYVGVEIEKAAASGNQINALGRGLNALAEEMSDFVRSMSSSGEAVVDSTIALAENMQTVVQSSNHQSEFAQSVSASIEQMTVTIDHVADGARETESIASDSRQLSESGVAAVDDAAREISDIADCVHQLSQVVSSLGERSGDISGIVDVIRKISEQTNVLALNAAVEAARAGEHGRGFAIVAGEVRSLAAQTGQATTEIAELIDGIRQQINEAIQKMDVGKQHVEKGVQLAATAKESLADIMKGTDLTVGKVQEITAATHEQATASKDIARNFEAIAQRAEHEAESITEISSAVSNLEQMSAKLHSLVYRFNY